MEEPRTAYIAPLYRQAKDVGWTYLKRFTRDIPGAVPNESELRVDLPNRGRVRLYGADNPDGMRGIYLDDCVLDEFADMRPSVLPEIIRPALSDRKGGLTVIGTPKGYNDFYEVWKTAQSDPEWFSLMLKASETGLVADAELQSAQKMMSPEQYAQEYECSFEAAIRGAYWGKEMAAAMEQGRICELPVDNSSPVQTAWDIGVHDATAIWFFQMLHGGINIIDYYESYGGGLDVHAKAIREKGYNLGTCYVPHDAEVKEWGTGRTRLEQMHALQLETIVVPKQSIMDGIGAARETLARCKFDKTRCADGLEALRQYRTDFDEKMNVFKSTPRHDWACHGADAFRYLSLSWREPEKKDSQRVEDLMKQLRRRVV